MQRNLIAVLTCHRFRERANVVRRTWAPFAERAGFDVRFFLGAPVVEPAGDEVIFDIPDDYVGLRRKVQAAFAWGVQQGYQSILKTDDDTYVIPGRMGGGYEAYDYVGRVRGPSRENDAPRLYGASEASFCSGFGYSLTAKSALIVAEAPDNGDWAEDRFTGQALARAGIRPRHHPGFLLWPPLTGHMCARRPLGSCHECLQQYANAVVVCPYSRPNVVATLHQAFSSSGILPTWIP